MPEQLIAPLAPDCADLRDRLVAGALPPVWQLEPDTVRALHLQANLAARPAWEPSLDALAVDVDDLPGGALPAMRRYRPRGRVAEVVLVWLHGGGWVLGSIETADSTCRTICALTGFDVLSVEYRCAPEHPFPAAVDDTLAAVRGSLGRGQRVVVGGDSAGGTLAAVAGREVPGLAGQLLVYPATDPSLRSPSAQAFVEGPFLTRRDMEWFYDQYVGPEHSSDPRVDLTGPVDAAAPAVLLTVGHDPLRDEGIAYGRALEEAGVRVDWIHAPELYHGCLGQSGVLPSAGRRLREVCAAAVTCFT